MKPLTFIHKSIPSAIIWYLFILNPFHVFASQTPSTHVTLQHHTSTHDSWKDEKWKEKLPLILQKRKTLHRFMLPSYKSYQQPNEYDEGCEVFLLGTAHISSSSCEDVKLLMNHVHPDCLFLELCPQRVPILENPPPPASTTNTNPPSNASNATNTTNTSKKWFSIFSKFKQNEKKPSLMEQIHNVQIQNPGMSKSSALSSILLTQIQSDYASKLNITVGSDFREAFQTAMLQNQEMVNDPYPNCRIILGDRPVHLTLSRVWESLNLFSKIKLLFGLIWGSLPFQQPSDKELKEWMESILNDENGTDILSKSMKELSKHFPTIERVIIQERDTYMYAKLNQLALLGAKRIVAVVGAGHCPGIRNLVKAQWFNQTCTNPRDFELLLQSIIETKTYKIGHDQGEMQSLITDVLELNTQEFIKTVK